MQGQAHADRSLYEQELEKRFRGVDKHVAAANSEALRTAADVKALSQRVSSAEWRVDKVCVNSRQKWRKHGMLGDTSRQQLRLSPEIWKGVPQHRICVLLPCHAHFQILQP